MILAHTRSVWGWSKALLGVCGSDPSLQRESVGVIQVRIGGIQKMPGSPGVIPRYACVFVCVCDRLLSRLA